MNKTVILATFLLLVIALSVPAFAEEAVKDTDTKSDSEKPLKETNNEDKIFTIQKEYTEDLISIDNSVPRSFAPEYILADDLEPAKALADPDLQVSSSLLDGDMNKISTIMWDQSTFDYKIEVYNNGPEYATGVNVKIDMKKVDFEITDDPIDPAFDPETGIWTIGDLPVGEFATLILGLHAFNLGTFDFVSEVNSEGIDLNPNNNVAKNTLNVLTTGDPDLEIISWFGDLNGPLPEVTVGQLINYGIWVWYGNTPIKATGVVVNTGIKKTEFTIKSWKTVIWAIDEAVEMDPAFDPETGMWTIGDLPVEWDGAILLVQLKVLSPGTFVFVSEVTGDGVDPNTENNNFTSTLTSENPEASGGGDESGPEDATGQEVVSYVSGENVSMQSTGMGFAMMILAILLVTMGYMMPRRRG